jgi:hypothetical protein
MAMTFTLTSSVRQVRDHFEPEAALDAHEQRQLRGHLEQVDYATFAANREVLGQALQHVDIEKFGRLAVSAAQARARWVAAAMAIADRPEAMTADDVGRLAVLRGAYGELAEAYEALRRMVERGYVTFKAKA